MMLHWEDLLPHDHSQPFSPKRRSCLWYRLALAEPRHPDAYLQVFRDHDPRVVRRPRQHCLTTEASFTASLTMFKLDHPEAQPSPSALPPAHEDGTALPTPSAPPTTLGPAPSTPSQSSGQAPSTPPFGVEPQLRVRRRRRQPDAHRRSRARDRHSNFCLTAADGCCAHENVDSEIATIDFIQVVDHSTFQLEDPSKLSCGDLVSSTCTTSPSTCSTRLSATAYAEKRDMS